MKKSVGIVIPFFLITLLLIGCSVNTTTTSNSNKKDGQTVNLDASTFTPNSITIKKGTSITLTNTTGITHIVANGTWKGNTADPEVTQGAPVVNNVTFSTANQSLNVGPFTTAGTFTYYCSVHPDMNLTVIVR